jgi:hypothetical protein
MRSSCAEASLAKAMEPDPSASDITNAQGDCALRDGDDDAAFAAHDRAVARGWTGVEMCLIRTEGRTLG